MVQFLLRLSDYLRQRRRIRILNPRLAAGRHGEDIVHRYLRRQGYIVVARNFRARSGLSELDIVAWDGETLVFVEVKSRTSAAFGPPDRAMSEGKRRRLFRGAREYARRAGVDWSHVRFDVVGVLLTRPPDITHYCDVFPLLKPI